MVLLMVKYLSKNPQGKWQYRRDLPVALRPLLGKREIKKVLGETQAQALAAYPNFHAIAEKLISSAKANGTKALEAYLQAQLKARRITTETSPDDRWMASHAFLDSFPDDPETGDPIIPNERVGYLVEALAHGKPVLPPPNLRDALDFYAMERTTDNETANKEMYNRLNRVHGLAIAAIGKDKDLREFTRGDARSIRDHLTNTLKPSSAKRYIGQIAAAFNLINRERELGLNPIFKGISESIKTSPADRKVPMPDAIADIIAEAIKAKARDKRLLLVWNLCRATGARVGEIAGLRYRDISKDQDYIIVRYSVGRSIKNKASERLLPLLPAETTALRDYLSEHAPASLDDSLFGNWGSSGNGNDRASAALSAYVKEGKARYYEDHPVERPPPAVLSKMTLHSLRHAFTDKCRAAGVDSEVRRRLTGHAQEGMDGVYGKGPGLEALRQAVEKANDVRLQ